MVGPGELARPLVHVQVRRLEFRRPPLGAGDPRELAVPRGHPGEAAGPPRGRLPDGEAGELLQGNVGWNQIGKSGTVC